MSDNPLQHLGRGGRGAILREAFQNQPRRPGQISQSSETPPTEPTKPFGRAALLQLITQGGRGRAPPVLSPSTSQEPVSATLSIGRGQGLALALSKINQASHTSPVPRSPSPVSVEDVSPPTAEFEELAIGKHSGQGGVPLPMEVNYVRLRMKQNTGTFEYHVSFLPIVDSQRMKFKLMNDEKVKNVIGAVKTFDGAKLYLPFKLQSSPEQITVNMPTDNSPVTISIKLIKKSAASDLIHLYNLLFKRAMRLLQMTQVGRNYFNPKGGIPVPQHKLEVWPGYVTAVQEFEGGIMLNCDASFRVLRTITARDILREAIRKGNVREEALKLLVGCVVLTRYNNKTYRVDDIDFDSNPVSTFSTHGGGEISFVDYYKKSYDIEISDLGQPLLVHKEKKKMQTEGEEPKLICLVPELCFMTGLTDDMRSDFRVMKDIAAHTRVAPEQRQLVLQKYIDDVNNNPATKLCFDNWNLVLEQTPLPLTGRLLDSETLYFGNGVKIKANPEADWGRQATSNKVLVPVHLQKWAVVFWKRDEGKIHEFVKMLRHVCPQMGINVNDPMLFGIHNDRTETYCNTLRDIIKNDIQIVVVVFPTPRDDRYSSVKKLCCIEMPIPSQAINVRTISDARKLRSVVQKIALQMNCKLGGELWSVHIPLQNLMVCGQDTYHDSIHGKNSVLAFVASINQSRTRWFSMTTIQKPGQEAGDALRVIFLAALRKYYDVNHSLPEKIILYRDGVGDGQMDMISQYEVKQLLACFKHFGDNYSPSLSVVVVQKRINTRMYTVEQFGNRKALKNPPPGSVLDHTVTRKKWYDFFLVSQHVRQGTVAPTHYVVIYDSSSLKPDHMQRIAYKMTHLYYNWPGTVRVPAPCQYAHKMAYLVGQNLHKDPHAALSDKLFYL